jgi:hypothetical protein
MLAGGAHAGGTLAFSPASANFGSVTVGGEETISLTITNVGVATTMFNNESLSGSGFSETGFVVPCALAPGAHLTITLKFAPSSAGQFSGYITFGSNATNSKVNYQMAGTGVAASAGATLAATPSSASFGNVPLGSRHSQVIQLKNTGATNLTISSLAASNAEFKLTGLTTPYVLLPGQVVNCTAVFAPTTAIYAAASATITSTAVNKTLTLTMSGTGVPATRVLTATPTSLNFGNESVGSTHTLAVGLTNSGNSSVMVSGINVSATDIATSGGITGATIAPGQTATLNVSFSPKNAETVSGGVMVTSNATDSPTTIAVSGVGVPSTGHSVALNWQASTSSNIVGYYVYRATGQTGTYSVLATAPLSGLKYTDASVASGETYMYAVTAVDSSGNESGYSSSVMAVIP